MRPEVLVFVMNGCPACGQLKPLAQQVAAHYRTCIDTRVVDVDADAAFADAMGVEELPTVIGVNGAKQPQIRMVGHDGKPGRLVEVYSRLLQGVTSCSVAPFRDV
jgi:hypothetical protein